MSSTSRTLALWLAAFAGAWSLQAAAAEVCPAQPEHPLRFVDVFDGAPAELAKLMPDATAEHCGNWQLGYIYDAGRFVTVRCKYAGGQALDVKLSDKVSKCSYRVNADKTLTLSCE